MHEFKAWKTEDGEIFTDKFDAMIHEKTNETEQFLRDINMSVNIISDVLVNIVGNKIHRDCFVELLASISGLQTQKLQRDLMPETGMTPLPPQS